jgi:hypothetical protein
MVFDSAGVLRDDAGAELARVVAIPDPGFARLTIGADSYEIEQVGARAWHLRMLDAGSRVVYDFHPGVRRGGTLRSGAGEELAKLMKRLIGRDWTIVPTGAEPIAARRRALLRGPVLSDSGLAGPELELSIPVGSPSADADMQRLLAFTCWVIAGWEMVRPGSAG